MRLPELIEESWLIPVATQEIITPYGNESAAQVLYDTKFR